MLVFFPTEKHVPLTPTLRFGSCNVPNFLERDKITGSARKRSWLKWKNRAKKRDGKGGNKGAGNKRVNSVAS